MTKHPAAEAWDAWKANNTALFQDSPSGEYLENRISLAFSAGWSAAEQEIAQTLNAPTQTKRIVRPR